MKILFNKIKNIALIILFIIAAIAILATWYYHDKAKKEEAAKKSALTEIDVKTMESQFVYKNKLDKKVTRINEYEKYISDLENSHDSLERLVYETIKASDSKLKQVENAYAISLSSHVTGLLKTDTLYIDSTKSILKAKTFKNLNYDITIIGDTIDASYDANFVILSLKRREPRKWQFMKWAGWEWMKTTDRNMVELTSNDTSAVYNGRIIKMKDNIDK